MSNNATKINAYNNFLSSLDKNKSTLVNYNKSSNLSELIKNIENNYKENRYNSIHFSGWGSLDIIKSKLITNNPDEYIDFLNDTPTNKKRERNKRKELQVGKEKKEGKEGKEGKDGKEGNYEKIFIETNVCNLTDLLNLIEKYPPIETVEYNLNMKILHDIKEPLVELNNMIGMNNLKKNLLDQILYYLQDLHLFSNDYLHTVIYGPPGTGKTEIAKIIGKIYTKMGLLKSGVFKKVTRSDLISGYLGQTALKTRDVIQDCLGGVLFIDEAYSLGNPEKRDSFSKECIDTLCEALSNHKDNLMVIIAGYENELKECFFSYNQGLDSRFNWRFKTDDYKAEDLKSIFLKKITDIGWKVEEIQVDWFEKNIDYFKYYGRDMETLLSKVKIAHSRRMFGKIKVEKKVINQLDMDNGLKLFLENEEVKSRKYNPSKALASMYI